VNLTQLQDSVYAHLGTTASDRAFLPEKITRYLNDSRNELIPELPGGYRQGSATWVASSATARTYVLASQAVPVTGLVRILALRLRDAEGTRLTEVRYEQREEWGGYAYAVTGPDEAATITTNRDCEAGIDLYAEFETWPSELAVAQDTPSEIPARFHDVLALMAAELAFASGGEGRFPAELARKLEDRRAQLWSHTGRRSLDVSRARETSTSLV
jgi:hypothetical protein